MCDVRVLWQQIPLGSILLAGEAHEYARRVLCGIVAVHFGTGRLHVEVCPRPKVWGFRAL